MKKIIAVVAAATLTAGVVFADGITFGSWGRGLFIGAANAFTKSAGETENHNNVVTGTHQSWGGSILELD